MIIIVMRLSELRQMCDFVEVITINYTNTKRIAQQEFTDLDAIFISERYRLQCHGAKVGGAYTASEYGPPQNRVWPSESRNLLWL